MQTDITGNTRIRCNYPLGWRTPATLEVDQAMIGALPILGKIQTVIIMGVPKLGNGKE